ncbi:MAG: valine--tRNA ligase [Parcubacteria group bacterium]|nr:valine--tRNA ligase [Parcubacteria group bacterium]
MPELPKKYNIGEREKHWQDFWAKEDVFAFDEKSDKPIYSVDTPPPYVSADHLHTGHIMSYSQAEFVVRYKRMRGFNVYYPMGFDDNGLPTERFVEKKHKVNKKTISRPDFIKLCLEETKKGAETYRKLWTDLGISVDWSKTYSTINDLCQRRSQWSFIDLYKKGKIQRAKKPILWCTTCQTAIAQADLDAEERKGKIAHIKVKVKDTKEDLIFATTRPELLPACMGISVNPDDKRYQHLIGKTVVLPLTGQELELTADKEGVDPEFGSGVVYFCSYGGGECIEWMSRHPEAKPTHILDPGGKFNKLAGNYAGLSVGEARKKILADLDKAGALVKIESLKNVTHVHERCGTDVEYIPTEQWFIKLLDDKDKLLEFGAKLNWHPADMAKKYVDWVESLKWDWCISRQRYYGVPFPLWYCKECQEVILPEEDKLPVDPSTDTPDKPCPKCGSKEFTPELDVMDTWMTSSMTPYIIRDVAQDDRVFPNTLRPQAFEIIRTWLFYSVAKAYLHDDSIPFKDVMISGHGLDEHGRKISKSLGNYVEPSAILEEYGADAIRYWATGASLGANMRYSEEEIKKGKKTVNKLWNATKFCLSHFEDLDLDKKVELEPADQWVLDELYNTIVNATKDFDNYEYSKARNNTDAFFWQTFTDNYLEFIKYRLYNQEEVGEESFVAAQQTLYVCISAILKLYAPIMPFITEELYQAYFKDIDGATSIHVSAWPEAKGEWSMDENKRQEFIDALDVIWKIRKYKSDQQISLGKEIDEFAVKNKDLPEKYFKFIEKAARVKKLIK